MSTFFATSISSAFGNKFHFPGDVGVLAKPERAEGVCTHGENAEWGEKGSLTEAGDGRKLSFGPNALLARVVLIFSALDTRGVDGPDLIGEGIGVLLKLGRDAGTAKDPFES